MVGKKKGKRRGKVNTGRECGSEGEREQMQGGGVSVRVRGSKTGRECGSEGRTVGGTKTERRVTVIGSNTGRVRV